MSHYMITDGERYIRLDATGAYVPIKSKALGMVWEQRCKAKNILENCISKNFRKRYRIEEIADNIVESKQDTKKQEDKKEQICAVNNSVVINIANQVNDDNIDKLKKDISGITEFVQSAEQRREELILKLSDVDQEISDINHYIELRKLNCYQGWLAYNMLRNRLIKRRKIKDELSILFKLEDCKVNSEMISEMKTQFDALETREYKPRKLKELFE